MKHVPVDSSHIKSVAHDPEANVMHVTFKTGATYAYHGVTAETHKAMMESPSVGTFHASHIRGKYKETKL